MKLLLLMITVCITVKGNVFVVYDEMDSQDTIYSIQQYFTSPLSYLPIHKILDDGNVEERDIDCLYLCSSSSSFDYPAFSSFVQSYVSSGGIVLYAARNSSAISKELSLWLNETRIDTEKHLLHQTAMPSKSISMSEIIQKVFQRDKGLRSNNDETIVLRDDQEQFCILFNDPLATNIRYGHSNRCWLYAVPHGNGYVVEISVGLEFRSPASPTELAYYIAAARSADIPLGTASNLAVLMSTAPSSSGGGPSGSPGGPSVSSEGGGPSTSMGGGGPSTSMGGGPSGSTGGGAGPSSSVGPTKPVGGTILPPAPIVSSVISGSLVAGPSNNGNGGNNAGQSSQKSPNGGNGASIVAPAPPPGAPAPPGGTQGGSSNPPAGIPPPGPAPPNSAEQAIQACKDCQTGQIYSEITNDQNGPQGVSLQTNQGANIGQVLVPQELSSTYSSSLTLEVRFAQGALPSSLGNIGESVLEINLYDSIGNEITQLSSPMTICIEYEKDDNDLCLAFYSDKKEDWICEDRNPIRTGNTYCGKTSHLTSFALLLDTDTSDEVGYIIAWLSLAFISAAIITILFAVILIEIRYQRYRYRIRSTLRSLSEMTDKPSLATSESFEA